MFTEIYAATRRVQTCRCHARIELAQGVKTLRVMPFNHPIAVLEERRDAQGRLIQRVDLGQNHWQSCAKAAHYRTRQASYGSR